MDKITIIPTNLMRLWIRLFYIRLCLKKHLRFVCIETVFFCLLIICRVKLILYCANSACVHSAFGRRWDDANYDLQWYCQSVEVNEMTLLHIITSTLERLLSLYCLLLSPVDKAFYFKRVAHSIFGIQLRLKAHTIRSGFDVLRPIELNIICLTLFQCSVRKLIIHLDIHYKLNYMFLSEKK